MDEEKIYEELFQPQIKYLQSILKVIPDTNYTLFTSSDNVADFYYYIYNYTNNYYRKFISRYRQNLLSAVDMNIISVMNSIFDNIPPVDSTFYVYKGMKTDDFNKNVYAKPFISTSLFMDSALEFTEEDCCIFRIRIPQGSKVIPLLKYSYFPEEYEVLLLQNVSDILTEEYQYIPSRNDYMLVFTMEYLS